MTAVLALTLLVQISAAIAITGVLAVRLVLPCSPCRPVARWWRRRIVVAMTPPPGLLARGISYA